MSVPSSLPSQSSKCVCVCVCYVRLYVLHEWRRCLWSPQEDVISAETVVIGNCEQPRRCWKTSQGPLQEQLLMFLTMQSPVQAPHSPASPLSSFMLWPQLHQALWEWLSWLRYLPLFGKDNRGCMPYSLWGQDGLLLSWGLLNGCLPELNF